MAGLRLALAALLCLALPPIAAAQEKLDSEIAFDESQAAIGGLTGDHILTDQNGAPLALADLRGRPLVVSLVFTSCATVCPLTTENLRKQILRARQAVGDDAFAVLTFGFDARGDTPEQLAGFAGTHKLKGIPDWYVASADADTTAAFLDDLGFSFRAAAGGFDHVTQTTVLDAEGRVYRQIYGENFPLPVLVQPLKELVLGIKTVSIDPKDLWNRISFLCTVYNPLTGAYRFDYGIFFGIFFGGVSLIITGLIILRLGLQRRRAQRARAGQGRASEAT
ncbi:MAG: SCO family protein [Roseovarius sp.]|nr:SCO family protein [Roseovarius sp.]